MRLSATAAATYIKVDVVLKVLMDYDYIRWVIGEVMEVVSWHQQQEDRPGRWRQGALVGLNRRRRGHRG